MNRQNRQGRKEVSLSKSLSRLRAAKPNQPHKDNSSKRGTSFRALSVRGSFTVEASVILPIVLFLALFVFLLSRILMLEWGMTYALDEAARNLALYGSAVSGKDAEKDATKDAAKNTGAVSRATAVTYANTLMKQHRVPVGYVDGGYLGLNYAASEVTDNWIVLNVRFRVSVPFPILSHYRWNLQKEVRARRFTGWDPDEDGFNDLYVLITPYGTAYHLSTACPYLCPSIRCVSKSSLTHERNESGGKYHVCPLCGAAAGSYVYVTNYGTVYHASLSCSGLKRTIQRVKLSEADGYHACPKCASGGSE